MTLTTDPVAPTAEETVEVPHPEGIFAEPWSAGKLARYLGFFGPAAVVAALSIGAGETIMATGLGAWSQYGLLWVFLLSVLVKGVFMMYLLGRYTAVTGQLLATRLVDLPGPRGWVLVVFAVAQVTLLGFGLTAIAKPCGNLIAFITASHFPELVGRVGREKIFTTLFLIAALGMSLHNGYAALEKHQTVVCGVLVFGTMLATVLVRPDWSALLAGLLGFGTLPPVPEWGPPAARKEYVLNLTTIFGFVGGGTFGYVVYGNWVALHGWGLNAHPEIEGIRARAADRRGYDYLPADPKQAARMRALLTPLRWDVAMGALTLLVVSVSFAVAGAVVLYPRHVGISGDGFNLLTKQAAIWEQIHPALVPIYYAAVLIALWGALVGVPEAITRFVQSFFGAVWPRFQEIPHRRLQAFLVAGLLALSILWTWSDITFDLMTQIGGLITLNLGGALLCLAAVWLNATLPRLYRPRWWVLAGGALSVAILTAAFIGSAIGFARKMMG